MTSYQDLKDKPKRFHSLTGYTPEEFSAIAPTFSKREFEKSLVVRKAPANR